MYIYRKTKKCFADEKIKITLFREQNLFVSEQNLKCSKLTADIKFDAAKVYQLIKLKIQYGIRDFN